jgi:hypothetical protein
VLLDFWEPRDGQNDMTILKEVQENFGADRRFVLVSLACCGDAPPAERVITQDGLNWTHGFAADFVSGSAPRYRIRAGPQSQFQIGPDQKYRRIPLTFLNGPDGRIVGHDLGGNVLGAVGKALENPKLFPAGAK